MPVSVGTLIEVEMFNGVSRIIAAGTATHDPNGNPISAQLSAGWSSWDFSDGGPMGPKFRSYRLLDPGEQRLIVATNRVSDQGSRPIPKWLSSAETHDLDMASIRISAEERVKRGQAPDLKQAVISVYADCVCRNENPAHEP